MLNRIRRLAAYPLLLAAYPIAHLYAANADRLEPRVLLKPLAASLAATLALLLLFTRLLRGATRGGLLAGALVTLFFSYGHVLHALDGAGAGVANLGAVLLALWGLLLALAVWAILKWGHRARPSTPYLNLAAALLVAVPLVSAGLYALRAGRASGPVAATEEGRALEDAPDIYYIILDGYARADVIQARLGYDNGDFVAALRERGFYVADETHSNYVQTFLSLASSLNVEYLDTFLGDVDGGSADRAPAYQLIQDNEVARRLAASGYTTLNFSSSWGPTDFNPYADVNYRYSAFNEFDTVLWDTTPLSLLFGNALAADRQRQILYNFQQFERVAEMDGPTFTFAHLLVPHPPYVFDRDGNLYPPGEEGTYVEQLLFTNRQVEMLVDALLENSEVQPIIILQGDHGLALEEGDENHVRQALDAQALDVRAQEALAARFGNLNAYLVPEEARAQLYPGITPVNSFRVVLDALLGSELGLLEDRQFFSTYAQPYQFYEVDLADDAGCPALAAGRAELAGWLLDWQAANGLSAGVIAAGSAVTPPAGAAGSPLEVELWSADEASLRYHLVTWLGEGRGIVFVDAPPGASVPASPLGASLETVAEIAVACEEGPANIRVRQVVDAGPELTRMLFESVFPNPNDYAEEYRAIALHLIESQASGAVVVYPPNQLDLLSSRLQWGTQLGGVFPVGEGWPLATQAATQALADLSAQYGDLHVVLLDDAVGDPDGALRAWLDGNLRLVAQQSFGPVELLDYTPS